MIHFTYLTIDFLTVIICFIFSFHPKIRFDKQFLSFILSSVIVSIPFIIWDSWFTNKGIWWFNERYTTGIRLGNLPIEEILFFIFIPFSCVFTYQVLKSSINLSIRPAYENLFVLIAATIGLLIAVFHVQQPYTLITFLLASGSMITLKIITKPNWLLKTCLVYTILTPGFLLVNGVLTGTGLNQAIVNYNPANFMNIRIFTIPLEDAVYGYILFSWNVYLFEKLQYRFSSFTLM